MRTRLVPLAFALGLAAVGVAAAGMNGHWRTHPTGDQEVPPNASRAQAQASFKLSKDGSSLSYKLNVANIENVTQAHIHVVDTDPNGPIVAWLYPNDLPLAPRLIPGRSSGTLGEGTIMAEDLAGPLAGQPLSALVAAIDAGSAYVNVHTTQFPPGEVRGNLP
jgi:hypothetical protein